VQLVYAVVHGRRDLERATGLEKGGGGEGKAEGKAEGKKREGGKVVDFAESCLFDNDSQARSTN